MMIIKIIINNLFNIFDSAKAKIEQAMTKISFYKADCVKKNNDIEIGFTISDLNFCLPPFRTFITNYTRDITLHLSFDLDNKYIIQANLYKLEQFISVHQEV